MHEYNKQHIKAVSKQILTLCENPNTALQAIHLIVTAGGAGELSWQVVHNRVMMDKDVQAGCYLIYFAQKIDDLPFEVLPLIELVLTLGDDKTKRTMLDKLPQSAKDELCEMGLIEC